MSIEKIRDWIWCIATMRLPATLSPFVPINCIKVYSPDGILLVHEQRYSDGRTYVLGEGWSCP